MTEIRLEGIGKQFGRVWAVRGVDLTVQAGEFLTLVGPSGCGKSTLLHLLAGLESPTEGRIRFDGKDMTRLSPRERDVAVVFQTYALYPHLTVRENIGFPLRMAKRPRAEIEDRVLETAEWLRIPELLDRKPAQLSGGQRQRVAVARALVRRPALFLLDEPLSNLDAKLRTETRVELKRIHEQLGTTFLYVTHDQTEAMTLSGRLAVLEEGRIHQVGEPEAVYSDPEDEFVATFLGSPPMNLLPAETATNGLQVGDQVIAPPAAIDPGRWRQLEGTPLHLGVRPEQLALAGRNAGDRAHAVLEAELELVEPLGAESLVHARYAGTRLTARVAPAAARQLERRVRFSFAVADAVLFHRQTGARVR